MDRTGGSGQAARQRRQTFGVDAGFKTGRGHLNYEQTMDLLEGKAPKTETPSTEQSTAD